MEAFLGVGSLVRAEYNYESTHEGDLPLDVNDIARITRILDFQWVEGHNLFSCAEGLFPVNHVICLTLPSSQWQIAFAHTHFPYSQLGDLELNRGDMLLIESQIDSQWAKGVLVDALKGHILPQRGIFPLNFVVLLDTKPDQPFRKLAKVKFELNAKIPEEMSAFSGQEIWITGEEGKMYYQASSLDDSMRGLVPKSFIEFVEDDCVSVTSSGESSAAPPQYPPPALPPISPQLNLHQEEDVTPYGRVKYAFVGECKGEMSVDKDELVEIMRHVDGEWILVRRHGFKGLIPLLYLDIIVDCPSLPNSGRSDPENEKCPLRVGENHRVLHDFDGPEMGDLRVNAGEIITITDIASVDWVQALDSNGQCGIIPVAFVDLNVCAERCPSTPRSNVMHRPSSPRSNVMQRPHSMVANYPTIPQIDNIDVSVKKCPPPRPMTSPAVQKTYSPTKEQLEAAVNAKQAEIRERRTMEREKIVQDLVRQENDYNRDMKIISEVLNEHKSVLDVETLLGGFAEVIHLSNRVMKLMHNQLAKRECEQQFGAIFVDQMDSFAQVYKQYFLVNESAKLLLAKYESDKGTRATIQRCVESMKSEGCMCLDMNSALGRPISRLLKYPLFIDMIYKITDDNHCDKLALGKALLGMADIAQSINETKRKNDLVVKYRSEGGGSRMSKLNMHSVRKKTSRLSARLSSSIGLASLVTDDEFDALQICMVKVEKDVESVLHFLRLYSDHVQHYTATAHDLAHSFSLIFTNSPCPPHLLSPYCHAIEHIANNILPKFFTSVQNDTVRYVKDLKQSFQGPNKLISKRADKILDLETAVSKSKSMASDATRRGIASEHQRIAEAEYRAMNGQLKGELPTLIQSAQAILYASVTAFVHSQRKFAMQINNAFKPVDGLCLPEGNIVTSFTARYRRLCDQMSQLSLVKMPSPKSTSTSSLSASFRKTSTSISDSSTSTQKSKFKSYIAGKEKQFPDRRQTQQDKDCLRLCNKGDVYVVMGDHTASDDQLELAVHKDDHVLPLILKDPLGNTARWYVDNGQSKGFVPSALLRKLDHSGVSGHSVTSASLGHKNGKRQAQMVRTNSDQPLIDMSSPLIDLNSPLALSVIDMVPEHDIEHAKPPVFVSKPIPVVHTSQSSISTVIKPAPPPKEIHTSSLVVKAQPTVPLRPLYDNVGYDIVSECQSRQLTPRRCAPLPPTTSRMSIPNDNLIEEVDEDVEFCSVLYDYCGGENELSVVGGQVVAVHAKHDVDGNCEWWLVETEMEEVGYIPHNYVTHLQ